MGAGIGEGLAEAALPFEVTCDTIHEGYKNHNRLLRVSFHTAFAMLPQAFSQCCHVIRRSQSEWAWRSGTWVLGAPGPWLSLISRLYHEGIGVSGRVSFRLALAVPS